MGILKFGACQGASLRNTCNVKGESKRIHTNVESIAQRPHTVAGPDRPINWDIGFPGIGLSISISISISISCSISSSSALALSLSLSLSLFCPSLALATLSTCLPVRLSVCLSVCSFGWVARSLPCRFHPFSLPTFLLHSLSLSTFRFYLHLLSHPLTPPHLTHSTHSQNLKNPEPAAYLLGALVILFGHFGRRLSPRPTLDLQPCNPSIKSRSCPPGALTHPIIPPPKTCPVNQSKLRLTWTPPAQPVGT